MVRMFLIRLDAQWWVKSHSETEAIEHLVKVIYRDKFLDKHHPAFQCVAIQDVDEFEKEGVVKIAKRYPTINSGMR